MPKPDDEREDPVEPSLAKIPEYLVERFSPRSQDPVVVFGGHLLQVIGAIAVTYVVLHFLFKFWCAAPRTAHNFEPRPWSSGGREFDRFNQSCIVSVRLRAINALRYWPTLQVIVGRRLQILSPGLSTEPRRELILS